jgi:hypothetical protein
LGAGQGAGVRRVPFLPPLLHQVTAASWAVWADAARAATWFHGQADDDDAGGTGHQRGVEVLAKLDIDQVVFPAGWACTAVMLSAHLTTAVQSRGF